MATYEEVYNASLKYFNGDELASKVFSDKYALVDNEGDYKELTPDDMHHRLAKEFARIEKKYPNPMSEEEIYDLMKGFKYVIPQGSPMAVVGNPYQIQSVGNCFVLEPVVDSYGGICKSDQEIAQLSKRRAGIGLCLDNLRPKGQPTKNASRTTDGIGIFMERFSNTIREVGQGGRRAAGLLCISVHHPEIQTFINIKKDLTKVTGANISVKLTEEFLLAVSNNEQYQLRWPVDNKTDPKVSAYVNAKEIWNEIIQAAWQSADPGLLFFDTIQKMSPADIYGDIDDSMITVGTNPCITGDTKVAVADGRGLTTISKLAKENKDIPVYCLLQTGKIGIKMMRNPRITGFNQKIYKITLENGETFKATGNHKVLLRSLEYKEVKDLVYGDSLHIGYIYEASIKDIFPWANSKSQNYIWLKNGIQENKRSKTEHRMIWEFFNNKQIEKGFVIHHKDFNAQNNNINNLECLSKKDHDNLHANNMKGKNNPIWKLKSDPVKWEEYRKDHKVYTQGGTNNVNFSGFNNDELFLKVKEWIKILGYKPTKKEYMNFAKANNLPQGFSSYRKQRWTSVNKMINDASDEIGVYNKLSKDMSGLLKKQFLYWSEHTNLQLVIENNKILVVKTCEGCKKEFKTTVSQRERSYCDYNCFHENNPKIYIKNYSENKKEQQLKVYCDLKFKLKRDPSMFEWEQECKSQNVPYRVGQKMKFGFKSFTEIKEKAKDYNHKVESVEFCGYEDVYNGTVDDVHNFYFGGWESINKNGKKQFLLLNNKQCGEIPMGRDSCRLMLLNLFSFVENPFTPQAKFNFNKFSQTTQKNQRLMDDLVDIELEKISKIIEKIESDPEPLRIKRTELEMWAEYKRTAELGRRTGAGITALGDTLAALNIVYGSKESIEVTEKIYKTLCLNAYKSSCLLAKERGHFKIYSFEKELNHPFIEKIYKEDPEIKELSKQYGRRNICLLTTAPAGSVSCLTQTTSGIEPVFRLFYTRRKKINSGDKETKVNFIDDMGDKWQHFDVYHHGLQKWIDITGETDITKSPYWNATSDKIDWSNRIKMQGRAQTYIDHSISNTVNLPKETTPEEVGEIYMSAWKQGCKGITVYRDGSRSGVLISKDEDKNKKDADDFTQHNAPKRPNTLPCDIHHVKIKGDEWIILVGLLKDKPYEIFGGKAKYVSITEKYANGIIIKHPRKTTNSVYDLRFNGSNEDDAITLKDVVKQFENPAYGTLTRMISLSLRHGAKVSYICEQLSKDENEELLGFSRVISRVLKKYIIDGEKANSDKKCSSCGSEDSLVYSEGCVKCSNCGYSKCN